LKIEIWSDFTCPYCYLGKTKLELALDQFSHKEKVRIEYASFQLDPNAEVQSNKMVYDMLMEKFRQSLEQVRTMTEELSMQAEEIGLDFQFEKMPQVNTYDAHRLVKYAKKENKELEMVNKIFRGYFSEGKRIDDHSVLLDMAMDVGIEREAVEEVLSVNCCAKSVKTDIETASEIGIQGVPFFIFNEKYSVSGAQPVEVFINALDQIWQENHVKEVVDEDTTCKTNYCVGPDCED